MLPRLQMSIKKNYIAYDGSELTIEWYFTNRDKSNALSYFNDLSIDRKRKVAYTFEVLAETGKIFNKEKFRYEGDQIYAIKVSKDRFLCFFFDGAKVIITNAYTKKSAKMPVIEKQKALKAKQDYINRVKGETYYE